MNISKTPPSYYFFWGCVAWIFGIWGEVFWESNFWILFLFISSLGFFFLRKIVFVFVAIFCLGGSWAYVADNVIKDPIARMTVKTEYTIEGTLTSAPDVRENDQRFYVKGIVKDLDVETTFLVILPKDQKFLWGDEIELKGKTSSPRNFQDFNYREYLQRFGVRYIMKNPEILAHSIPEKKGITRKAQEVRNYFNQILQNHLLSPHQHIAMGMLLGNKTQPPEMIKEDFKNSGLQHILVVSGFNVTVLMAFVGIFLRRLGRNIKFIVGMSVLIFYVLMVGPDPPVLRASIFGAIIGWGIAMGRSSQLKNATLLAAVIMSLLWVDMVQSDVGFFLSFAATLGIITGMKWFEKKFEPCWWRDLFLVSWIAQLSVMPILILGFGGFSATGFIANILVEPLVPLAMLGAFLTIIGGSLSETLGAAVAYPTYWILECILWIAKIFGAYEMIPVSQIWGYALLIILGGIFLKINWKR